MRTRLLAAVAATVLLAGLAGCEGDASSPPSTALPSAATPAPGPTAAAPDNSCNPRASLRPSGALPPPGRMPPNSFMAKIQQRGRLILGTSQDTLLFSSRNPITGKVEGFDVDMARQIAAAIFGDPDKIQIRVIPRAKRVDLTRDGTVDIVVSTMTANCARWKDVNFSTIYYEAGQKVLVSSKSPAKEIEDLGGRRVCAANGSTSLTNIGKVASNPPPVAVAMASFGDCLVAFQRNEVEAISTDDAILAGMAAQDPYARVIGRKFTKEPYGMAMSADHPEFTRFVNAVLDRSRANGTWTATYQKWLRALGPAPTPPAAQYR